MVAITRRHRRKRRTKQTSRKHTRRHNVRKHRVRRKTRHLKRRVKRRQTRHRRRRRMRGGRGCLSPAPYKVGTGIPGGKGSLPIDGRNYYALAQPSLHAPNSDIINPSVQLGGGLSSILPRDVVDLGRSMVAGVEELYDEWRGQPENISADPNVMDQNLKDGSLATSSIDVNAVYAKSNKLAAAV